MRNSNNYDTMDRNRSDYRGGRYDRSNDGAFFGSRSDDDYEDRGLYRSDRDSDWSSRDQGRFGRGNRDGRHDLIASDRVEGTAVYGRDGNKLGTIHNFMVGKRSGQVAFAVMKCSDGFLGLDERYYPLDWAELDYDTRLDGYRVNMSERDLDSRRGFDSSGHPLGRRSDENSHDRGYADQSSW